MKRVLDFERAWDSIRSSFSYVQIFPKWIKKGWKHVFAARHRSLWHHDPIPIVHGHVIVQQDIFEMESANAPILAISACTARKNRSRKNRLSAAPCHTNSVQFPPVACPGAPHDENAKMLSQEWKRNKNQLSCDLHCSRADDVAKIKKLLASHCHQLDQLDQVLVGSA